jgi:hypothetical protein
LRGTVILISDGMDGTKAISAARLGTGLVHLDPFQVQLDRLASEPEATGPVSLQGEARAEAEQCLSSCKRLKTLGCHRAGSCGELLDLAVSCRPRSRQTMSCRRRMPHSMSPRLFEPTLCSQRQHRKDTTGRYGTHMNLIQSMATNVTTGTTIALAGIERRLTDQEPNDVLHGWVLITLMAAGLVSILWSLAATQLTALFTKVTASQGPVLDI